MRVPDGFTRTAIHVGMMPLGERTICCANVRDGAAAVEAKRGVMVLSSALQFPSLLCGNGIVSFIQRGRSLFASRKQMRPFEQAAEVFFAGDVLCAFLVAEVGHGFVFHFEPFQTHDADVFPALFPELALIQFHASTICIGFVRRDVSLSGTRPKLVRRNRRLVFVGEATTNEEVKRLLEDFP